MHGIFISYHHQHDQYYKDALVRMGEGSYAFADRSVSDGDIPDDWSAEAIRRKIRDEYLGDSSVTILLCGRETRNRKHIDWELQSSMIDGARNKKSGLLVISLPSVFNGVMYAPHEGEITEVYSNYHGVHTAINSKPECERLLPYLPERIIDNLIRYPDVRISVCPWGQIEYNPNRLKWLVDAAYRSRRTNQYDTHHPMRKRNR